MSECTCTFGGECDNCLEIRQSCRTRHSYAVPLIQPTYSGDEIIGWQCADCHSYLPPNWDEGALR